MSERWWLCVVVLLCLVLAQITGFLGAGKTTLVNRILSGDHGLKIAVIENEVRQQTHAAAQRQLALTQIRRCARVCSSGP